MVPPKHSKSYNFYRVFTKFNQSFGWELVVFAYKLYNVFVGFWCIWELVWRYGQRLINIGSFGGKVILA